MTRAEVSNNQSLKPIYTQPKDISYTQAKWVGIALLIAGMLLVGALSASFGGTGVFGAHMPQWWMHALNAIPSQAYLPLFIGGMIAFTAGAVGAIVCFVKAHKRPADQYKPKIIIVPPKPRPDPSLDIPVPSPTATSREKEEDDTPNATEDISDPLRTNSQPNIPKPVPPELAPANDALNRVEMLLAQIPFRKIDLTLLHRAKDLFENNRAIRKCILLSDPQKNPDPNDPLIQFEERHTRISCWIQALEHHYYYYTKTSWIDGGLFRADDNGDCLFESFLQSADLNGSNICLPIEKNDREAVIHKKREEVVAWIERHYESLPELQEPLANSIQEHFHAKIEKLETNIQNTTVNLRGNFGESANATFKIQLETDQKELESIWVNVIPHLCAAFGEAHQGTNFEALLPIIPMYLADMKKHGEHAGKAELYALSCIHGVCIKVHARRGTEENPIIDEAPYQTINPQFETAERPARHLNHARSHYNSHCPSR